MIFASSLILLLAVVGYANLAKANATFRYHYHNIMCSCCDALKVELKLAATSHWKNAQHAIVDELSKRRDPEVES
jgi:nitrate/TMAO reductase-like tetraheme cytochrome c subunit